MSETLAGATSADMAGAVSDAAVPARLRTVLCTSGGLHGALVLARLGACERVQICGVIRSSRVLDPSFGFLQGAIAQVRCSGLRYALYLWVSTTLADWLCALHGRGVPFTAQGATPVLVTRDVNDAVGLKFLAACAPDLLVSAFFNQRLRPPALAVPTRACVNIHPSLLPQAKGVDPVFQCLLHGAPPLGVTVHGMTPDLDTGGILGQQAITPAGRRSVFEATALLFAAGVELLIAGLERIAAGDAGLTQVGAGSYQSWPSAADTARLRARGGALVRCVDLLRLARGRLPRWT